MTLLFYIAAGVALVATGMVITRRHAIHALLYLVMSLLASALMLYAMGAAFAAALEVILYAGAVLVLFLFVVMMLGGETLGPPLGPRAWIGPAGLTAAMLAMLLYAVFSQTAGQTTGATMIDPKAVGVSLYREYLLGAELAGLLLLAALVGGLRLGRRPIQEGQP